MGLKAGYKQTEVGMIPEDWEVKPLGAVVSFLDGKRRPVKDSDRTKMRGTFPYYGASGIVDYVNEFLFDDELILLGEDGENILSRNCRLAFRVSGKIWVNNHAHVLKPNADVSLGFLTDFLESLNYERFNSGTAQPKLNKQTCSSISVSLPPTKGEQEAIAEALSDADALIESLEQLLVKKRHIKQGAMQELLSPKPSDEVRLLREVSSLKGRIGWQGLKQTEFTSNDNEPFLITGMNFKDGAIRWNEVYHIPEVRYDMAPEIQLRPDDVLMTKDGTIGKVLYIDAIPYPSKASLNSHLLLFRPIKNSYCAKYLYYQLGSRRFQDYIEQSKSGTTFFGLSQAAVGEYPVLLPPMTDQIRVAATLSDMDTEIATLESKLSKARQLKTGMMQELLTGKIRLVRPSASAVPFVVEQKASASPQRSHNAQFNEAVVIAVLVHGFGTEQFPLGRFRRMKFTYLLHRHIEHETEGFLKKAAGPYNPSIKYGGAEKIALKNGYVREHSSGKFEGFISGDNIAQAEEYFENWYGLDALAWMEQFRHKKNDDLELLTTVDMASEELRRAGRAVNLSTVKQVIRSNAEWKAKLDRPVFSDPNIISAIHSCELILDVEGDGS